MKSTLLITSLLLLIVGSCNNSNQDRVNGVNKPSSSRIGSKDSGLLCEVYLAILSELKFAEEAKTRSAFRETKIFANAVFEEHLKDIDVLKAYAGTQGIELPFDLKQNQKEKWKKLVKNKGKLFDEAFINLMEIQQDEAIVIYKKLTLEAEQPPLKQIGSNFLAKVKNDKQMANSVKERFEQKNKKDST